MELKKILVREIVILILIILILITVSLRLYGTYINDQKLVHCINEVDKKWSTKQIIDPEIQNNMLEKCRKIDTDNTKYLTTLIEILK